MSLQIVNLGLPKTGTTTLARALRLAGYRVADHRIRARQDAARAGQYVADLLYRGRFEADDPGAFLAPFQALTETSLLREGRSLWPQMDYGLIDAIRRTYPKVKFLASRRDPFALSQSMLAWSDLGTARLPQAAIPGLPPGFGDTTKQRIQWIEAQNRFLDDIFLGDPDFLAFDIADPKAPAQISAHLGRKLPWWGRKNRNDLNRVA
ncbi:MAG: sulfotransferase [Pseudomonadota bacterium]